MPRTKEKPVEPLETYGDITNGAQGLIEFKIPYMVDVEVVGTAPFLFHRWNVEAVAEKAAAAKGSRAKKEDNIESYVYRTDDGRLAIPGEMFRMSLVNAARYQQDPRSPRKSAMDLYKAGVIVSTPMCTLGKKEWDYLDQRRVMVQRNGVTRSRPAMNTGWRVGFDIEVLTPEYISPARLNETLMQAGRLVGVGDFRPTFGRFQVVKFQVREL